MQTNQTFTPSYSSWRHGGWYVHNVRYPSGACGCVSRNYPDRKWRIVCDSRTPQPTFASRDAAAFAEMELAAAERANLETQSWIEYDHAAEDLARQGKTGAIGDVLPANMSAAAVNLINADPEAFERRVRSFAYARAMESVDMPRE